MSAHIISAIMASLSMVCLHGESQEPTIELPKPLIEETAKTVTSKEITWREGAAIPVRVPVAVPEREYMTTLSFPETRIETATTGWQTTDSGGMLIRDELATAGRLARKVPQINKPAKMPSQNRGIAMKGLAMDAQEQKYLGTPKTAGGI